LGISLVSAISANFLFSAENNFVRPKDLNLTESVKLNVFSIFRPKE
jgi:hypothetical protein